MKRPIDIKRDGAGSFMVGEGAGAISEMIVIDDRMIILSQNGVHETQLADHVDPGRTDINLPQVIQRQILPYGNAAPFIRETLAMGHALFDTHHLGDKFDKKKALSLTLKAAHDFAAMADLKNSLKADQDAGIAKLELTVKGNQLRLPTMPNLQSRIGSYLAHARAVSLSLLAIVELFYPKPKANDPWRANLEKGLAEYLAGHELAKGAFEFSTHVIELVNDSRNAFEHPDATKSVTVTDFGVVPGGKYTKPRVKIVFGSKPLAECDVDYLIETVLENLGSSFEALSAMLCDANIEPFGPLVTQIGEQPPEMVARSSRYAYQSHFKEGVVLPTSPAQKS
jgi:hypothetical protein